MKTGKLIEQLEILSVVGTLPEEISALCYDSRKAVPGSMFVAVRGYASDGHAFIPAAVAGGAVCVVCEQAPEADVPYILVADSRRALAVLASAWFGHPQDALRLIGVTGTKGKTTVTHLIHHILTETGEKCGLIGTNGCLIGDRALPSDRTTPESYELYSLLAQMRDEGCTCAVMEVSSHALVLDRVYGLHYAVAAFTNLSRDHLDFHGSMEEYFKAKSILFTRCDNAVINADDPMGKKLLPRTDCRVLTFGIDTEGADYVAKNPRFWPGRISFEALTYGRIGRVQLNIPGRFSIYNALTAITCCVAFGAEFYAVLAAINTAQGVKGRAEIVPTDTDFTVLIDYAHSPDSMENILTSLRPFVRGRLIALFGAGGHRDRGKRPMMGQIGGRYADLCVVTSDNPRDEEPDAIIREILAGMTDCKAAVEVIEDRRAAIRWAIAHAQTDDVIVLLGKGQETYQEVQGQKLHLDEREEVAAALAELRGEKA